MNISLSFYLKSPERPQSPVFISLCFHQKRVQISTGLQIDCKQWLFSGRYSGTAKRGEAELKSKLARIESATIEVFNKLSTDEKNDFIGKLKKELRQIYDEITRPEKITITRNESENNRNFVYLLEKFIDERSGQAGFSSVTIKNYRSFLHTIKEYEAKRRKTLAISDIDLDFYNDFMTYFNEIDYQIITVNGKLRVLKTFLHYLEDRGYEVTRQLKKFKPIKESEAFFSLTFDEIKMIENTELPPRLARIRDLFLIQISTGLRVSDLLKLRPENFNWKQKIISVETQKTRETLIIPISPLIERVLSRYPGGFIPLQDGKRQVISDQKYNLYLKEVCELAGLTDLVTITKHFGNRTEKTSEPKYKLITSHVARRSFVTNALRKQIRPDLVMKISGHRSLSSFAKYIKHGSNEAVEATRQVFE